MKNNIHRQEERERINALQHTQMLIIMILKCQSESTDMIGVHTMYVLGLKRF
jgi:hypothetical protein